MSLAYRCLRIPIGYPLTATIKIKLHKLLLEVERERRSHDAMMAMFELQIRDLITGKKQCPPVTEWAVPGPGGKVRIVRASQSGRRLDGHLE